MELARSMATSTSAPMTPARGLDATPFRCSPRTSRDGEQAKKSWGPSWGFASETVRCNVWDA